VGELVYTAFSGSHQDAIKKGMKALKDSSSALWEVPYLPIDPADVGRTYEAIIRINSQSGKGGIAYILEADHGLHLPRNLQVEFRDVIQKITDREGRELSSQRIFNEFISTYVDIPNRRLRFVGHKSMAEGESGEMRAVEATIVDGNEKVTIHGRGTGPVDGFLDALSRHLGAKITVLDYAEHSLQRGSDAAAICYMEIDIDGERVFGAAINKNIVAASLEAIIASVNRRLVT
jgi:2-isopropylmalate synthase